MLPKSYPGNRVPDFDEAITCLRGYPSLDQIPQILFRRLNQIISLERKPLDEACDVIAERVGFSRDAVKEKLETHPSTYRPLQEV